MVDSSGNITSKYFRARYEERYTPASMLSMDFGVNGGEVVRTETAHLTLTTRLGQDRARTGNRIVIDFEIELPERMHLYAPGVTGYLPLAVVFDENPLVEIHDTAYPQSEMLHLPAIGETVPVYHGAVSFRQEVTIGLDTRRTSSVQITGKLQYQACDDEICYLATDIPLSFTVDLDALDTQRARSRRGAEASSLWFSQAASVQSPRVIEKSPARSSWPQLPVMEFPSICPSIV